jgi:hypothetical protein
MNLGKIPEQIKRLFIVFAVFITAILLIRAFAVPPSLKETGFHRTSTTEREKAKEIQYAGAEACTDCHEDIVLKKKANDHNNLSCETCHGPAKKHAEDPDKNKPIVPRERSFCPLCHAYDPSRPTGYPQINPAIHNPMKPCIECHDPHNPEPPQPIQSCAACHGEIFRTKAVSPHAQVECTTCHNTPDEHKSNPRAVKPSKPDKREFCGKCHALDSDAKGVPKIDIATHGEKYLCWVCHYPHMPEAK